MVHLDEIKIAKRNDRVTNMANQVLPNRRIAYLQLVTYLVKNYNTFKGYQDFLNKFPGDTFLDVTDTDEKILMDYLTQSLPDGYTEKILLFKEHYFKHGLLEIVFDSTRLINVRCQLFTNGLFCNFRQKLFFYRKLIPRLNILINSKFITQDDKLFTALMNYKNLVINLNLNEVRPYFISTHIIDEDYY